MIKRSRNTIEETTENMINDISLVQELNKFKALANNIPQLAWVTDENGYIYWYNRRWYDYTGTTLEDMKGWGWTKVHHPDHVERVVGHLKKCIENGTDWQDTFPLLGKDGQYRSFLSRASVIRDENNKIIGWFGTNTDITEEEEFKKKLQDSEKMFRDTADTINHMIWITRPDGYHEYYNQKWYDFTGVPQGSTDGEEWNGMFHPDDQAKAWKKWERSLNTGEPYEIEYRLRDKTGLYRWVLGRALPLRDENGEIVKWCGTCTDIHPMKEAELRAEEASNAKSEFLASISHEIRTPLNAIIGVAGILSKGNASPEKTEVLLRTLRNGSDGLLKLVNDVLDISKIEQRDFKLEPTIFYLDQFLEEIVGILNVGAQEKGLSLNVNLKDLEGIKIKADRDRLKQVLINLVGNSIKFTEAGEINLTAKILSDDILSLEVEDTGIGIPEEYLGSIFKKFERAKNIGNIPGTGLGLSISKHLVEMMGGSIQISSTLGEGTNVVIILPGSIANSESIVTKNADHPERLNNYGHKKILLVEDYEPNILVMSTILGDIGVDYTIARDGEEALDCMKNEDYHLVLMDINMPKKNGLETTQDYRKWESVNKEEQTPIIGLTAHALSGDKDKCLNAGMDNYLSKPVPQDKLLEIINLYF